MHFRKGFQEKFSELIYITFFEYILNYKEEKYGKDRDVYDSSKRNLTWTTLKKIFGPFSTNGKISIDNSIYGSPRTGQKLLLNLINTDKYEFDVKGILKNPHITPKFMEEKLNHFVWDEYDKMKYLPLNKHFHLDDLMRVIEEDPCKYAGRMRNITPEIIRRYSYSKDFMRDLIFNYNVSLDFIFSHPELNWDLHCLNYRYDLTTEHIVNNPEVDWDWPYLSEHLNYNQIKKYPQLQWDRVRLMGNISAPFNVRFGAPIVDTPCQDPPDFGLFKVTLAVFDPDFDFSLFFDSFTTEKRIRRRNFFRAYRVKSFFNVDF